MPAAPQGTTLTYQGQLQSAGSPVSGSYDFRFSLWDSATNGSAISATQAVNGLVVSNGLFTAAVDFGPALFSDTARWLQIEVATNGAGTAISLSPRQVLMPTPYALLSGSASNLLGTVPAAQVTGLNSLTVSTTNLTGPLSLSQLPVGVLTNGAANVTLTGTFSGNFAGLTNFAYTNLQFVAPATMSVNLYRLTNLQTAALQKSQFRFLWLGDSIGPDTSWSVRSLFQRFSRNGLDRGSAFLSWPDAWYSDFGPCGDTLGGAYWGGCTVLSNAAASVQFAGPTRGRYLTDDTLQLWYLGAPAYGRFQVLVSQDSSHWTSVAQIDEATGSGLMVTNVPLARGSYTFWVTNISAQEVWIAGTGNTVQDSTSAATRISVCSAPGRDLANFMAMGSNNIVTLLRTLNPTVIFCQQLKDAASRTNWPLLKPILAGVCPTADVVLISCHPTAVDTPQSLAQVFNLDRQIAQTNGWAFVDVWTPLGAYASVAASGWSGDGIHYQSSAYTGGVPQGQWFEGDELVRQLDLLSYIVMHDSAPAGAGGGLSLTLPVVVPGNVTQRWQFSAGLLVSTNAP